MQAGIQKPKYKLHNVSGKAHEFIREMKTNIFFPKEGILSNYIEHILRIIILGVNLDHSKSI